MSSRRKAEQGIGLNEGTASRRRFSAATPGEMRSESRELLKNTRTGSGGTENRDCAGEGRIFSVRAAAAERITTGAESRNSARCGCSPMPKNVPRPNPGRRASILFQ